MVAPPTLLAEIIAKDNLNIENLMQTFENLLLQNYSTKFLDIHTNSPWVCVIKVCSNGGATYNIGEIIAKDNLNTENLMQTFENLLLQNYTPKLLDIAHRPWVCAIKDCSNDGPTYIICKIIAKNNLNKANLMQTFENLLLQNY